MKHFQPNNVSRLLFEAVLIVCAVVRATTQTSGGAGSELQQKLAATKQSVAENQQKLYQDQWTETNQLTLKDDGKT